MGGTSDQEACANINQDELSINDRFITPDMLVGNLSEPQSTNDQINLLKEIRISNFNRLIIGQLNINSLRKKFDFLRSIVSGQIDILVITETKLDKSFRTSHF